MKKTLIFIVLFTLIVSATSFGDVDLTEEEEEWLENHPIIYFAGDPSWPPIDFLDTTQSGLVSDYLSEMEEMLDIKFEYVYLESWEKIVEAIENKEVDVIAGSYHQSREDKMLFSEIILEVPYIMVTRNDYVGEITPLNLNTKTVATVEGWILNQILEENHPGITLEEYPSVADALKAVSFGNVDVLVQELASVSYEIDNHKITNLKYHADYPRNVDVRYIIRDDYDTLKVILDKSLDEMSNSKKREIYNRWISINAIPFYKQPVFLIILALILVIGVLSIVWVKTLHRQINIKTKALQNELENRAEIQSQLEASIERQNEIQREMVLQERMASLGSMVAGISHEVNNPLGVCLTTVSAFRSRFDKLSRAYNNENLTKSQFDNFMKQANEASKLIEDNLQNAIQTSGGFKNMAINQMQDEKELIDFCQFVLSMKETFKYELKKKQVNMEIVCANSVLFLGYPGALTQIFTNLIINSIVHAFSDEQESCIIEIKAAIIERQLVIEYKDNGSGISEDIIDNIFKLFFTTRRQEGGSGIGLHIVRNLLKEKFDGSITCMNREEGGVLFTLHIPITNH